MKLLSSRPEMRTSITRLIYLILLLSLPLPKAVWGQDAPTGKLDESLQQAVDAGCPGPQAVIIRTKPGYRQGLRESLQAHGDSVVGEFVSIDAVAATVHCDDLKVLESFTSTASVSRDATVTAGAKKSTSTTRSNALSGGGVSTSVESSLRATLGLTASLTAKSRWWPIGSRGTRSSTASAPRQR